MPPEVEPVEQRGVVGVGDHELAVGVADVAGELVAATGVVDADDRGAGQRGAEQGEQVVGGVVEQHADVERARSASADASHRAMAVAAGDDLAPGPRVVARHRGRPRRRRPGRPAARRPSSVAGSACSRRHVARASLMAFLAMMFFWISVAPAPIDV